MNFLTLERAVWIATVEMVLCVLCVLINQVNPKDQSSGVKLNAEYIITAEWNVDNDYDVDLHVAVPDDKDGEDIYYGHPAGRGVSLDHDDKGFVDSHVLQTDGSYVKIATHKELTTIRGKIPGRFDIGVMMFAANNSNTDKGTDLNSKVHVEVVKLNPNVKVLFAKDVVLHKVRESLNVFSFELNKAGEFSSADMPLALVTDHAFRNGVINGATGAFSSGPGGGSVGNPSGATPR